MTVICPFCNGSGTSVWRVDKGSVEEIFPYQEEGEEKKMPKKVKHETFYCSECGKEFTSDSKTYFEEVKGW